MPIQQLIEYLDDNDVKYTVLTHERAVTAQEKAASAHIRGKELAKTVMVKINGRMAMAVLPSSRDIDFASFRKVTGARSLELASEEEFRGMFPGCEVGAMPPFGNLYGLEVYAAPDLSEDERIAFNAGSHTELIELSYSDFDRLVKPITLAFSNRE